ncbi:HNH/ENDO VII family nuclease, partial [Enterococcus pernyi]
DTYQEKVNVAWRQGVNYETGEKLDPLLGSIVSTSQYVKDGYTWINESELGQALMILGFTYASYKVLTTTGVKQVESGKLKEVGGGEATNNYSQLREYWKKDVDFKGTKVYQRDSIIDINKIDVKGRSNLQRMELGLAPLGPDDNPINLHHMTQRDISSIAEVEQSFHQINSKTIHINSNSVPSGIDRKSFNKWRADYWKNRANDFK